MMRQTKPAFRSLGFLGSLGGIGSAIALLTQISELISNLPPDLIDETKLLAVTLASLVSSLVALVGRWRASFKIKGLF